MGDFRPPVLLVLVRYEGIVRQVDRLNCSQTFSKKEFEGNYNNVTYNAIKELFYYRKNCSIPAPATNRK